MEPETVVLNKYHICNHADFWENELREQIAANAFLKGLRNQKVANKVMNRDPVSLHEAQRLVTKQYSGINAAFELSRSTQF